MNSFDSADCLHRLVKHALDSGAADSLEEAETLFEGYRLCISISAGEAACPQNQAMILTTTALSRRVFLGGVTVEGSVTEPLAVPLPLGDTIGEAVRRLGARIGRPEGDTPTIVIGGGPQQGSNWLLCSYRGRWLARRDSSHPFRACSC